MKRVGVYGIQEFANILDESQIHSVTEMKMVNIIVASNKVIGDFVGVCTPEGDCSIITNS